jgi:hypothetical protein
MGFFDNFFGSTQADDITNASDMANRRYQQGLSQFTDTTKDYLGQSLDYLKPYAEAGGNTLKLLGDALGINGAQGGQSFWSNLSNDPGFQSAQQGGIDALDKSAAARGLLRSGGQNRDLFSFGQRSLMDFGNNRIAQLGGLLTPTMGAAGGSADLTSKAGSDIAGAQFGTSQLFANNATNTGNALAQSRNIGINNILGVGNMLAGFFKPAPTYNFGSK